VPLSFLFNGYHLRAVSRTILELAITPHVSFRCPVKKFGGGDGGMSVLIKHHVISKSPFYPSTGTSVEVAVVPVPVQGLRLLMVMEEVA
jgi:hypothetical protein